MVEINYGYMIRAVLLFHQVDDMLTNDITRLMAMLPQEALDNETKNTVKGGVFASAQGEFNPFATGAAEGYQLGAGSGGWIVNSSGSKDKYDAQFEDLNPIDGKVRSRELCVP